MNIKINEFSLPAKKAGPYGITSGSDGAVWFTENGGNKIGKILITGAITEYSVTTQDAGISCITKGNDSALWFTEYKANSKLLWNKGDEIRRLKSIAEDYPAKLRKEIIHLFSFEAGFSLMLAEKNVARDDVFYVVAHLVRSISALNQVLFALNEQYCINEKKAVKMIDTFNIHPDSYKNKVDAIFSFAGTDLSGACNHLKELINEVNGLL